MKPAAAPAKPGAASSTAPRVTLLPNGWRISPVGMHFTVGDLPMNMVLTPDGDHVVVTNNGYSQPNLVVYDHTKQITRERIALDSAWLGLAFHPDGKRLFSSGSAKNRVDEFVWDKASLKKVGEFPLPKPANESASSNEPDTIRVASPNRAAKRRIKPPCTIATTIPTPAKV